MENKPKNGYDRLKIKYDALKKSKENLQKLVEELQTSKSKLFAENHNLLIELEEVKAAHRVEKSAMLNHMGYLRRFSWFILHPKKKGE